VVGLVACRGGEASRESAPSTHQGQLPVLAPLPGDNDPAPASPAALPASLAIGERLAREQAARPAGAVRVEQLVVALEAKGIAVARTRQVLGSTLSARYCAIAVTAAGVVASVCELDSAEAAEAAQKDSEQRFGKAIPDRRFVTNGKSLLTIAGAHGAAQDEANAIAATFAALHTT
jgi:hypothetical protein